MPQPTPPTLIAEARPVDHADLVARLRALASEHVELKSWSTGLEAGGYGPVLAAAMFAVRARRLQERTVPLFGHSAHLLLAVDDARNIRLGLWRTSERLRWLFSRDGAKARLADRELPGQGQQARSDLRRLFYCRDVDSGAGAPTALHDAIVSTAQAAADCLFVRRPPLLVWRALPKPGQPPSGGPA